MGVGLRSLVFSNTMQSNAVAKEWSNYLLRFQHMGLRVVAALMALPPWRRRQDCEQSWPSTQVVSLGLCFGSLERKSAPMFRVCRGSVTRTESHSFIKELRIAQHIPLGAGAMSMSRSRCQLAATSNMPFESNVLKISEWNDERRGSDVPYWATAGMAGFRPRACALPSVFSSVQVPPWRHFAAPAATVIRQRF